MRSWLSSLAAELLPQWMSEKAALRDGETSKHVSGRVPANGREKAADHPSGDTPHDYAFPELEGNDEQEALRQAGSLKD